MACLSSSPPPLMPEDEDEDEDSSFAEGFADLSESDNVPYDLTGKKETFKRYRFYYNESLIFQDGLFVVLSSAVDA